jgi:hypothetical protein
MSPGFPLLVAFEPCIRWGLPSRGSLESRWWSLTPPFHPDHSPTLLLRGSPRLRREEWRFIFCGTFHRLRTLVRVVSHESGLLAVQPLAGITPCDARTFLTPLACARVLRDHAPFQAGQSVAPFCTLYQPVLNSHGCSAWRGARVVERGGLENR